MLNILRHASSIVIIPYGFHHAHIERNVMSAKHKIVSSQKCAHCLLCILLVAEVIFECIIYFVYLAKSKNFLFLKLTHHTIRSAIK